jgi:hypothetical protein
MIDLASDILPSFLHLLLGGGGDRRRVLSFSTPPFNFINGCMHTSYFADAAAGKSSPLLGSCCCCCRATSSLLSLVFSNYFTIIAGAFFLSR